MKLRSLLYVPGDNQRFVQKAHMRGADAIILDLEDSVLPENKIAARNGLASSIASVGQNGAKVFVRINSDLNTALLDAEAACLCGAFGLYVSKSSPEKLDKIHRSLSKSSSQSLPMVALIETPRGVSAAGAMACRPGVIALSLGGEDFAMEIGGVPDPDVLRLPRLLVHYAAKAQDKLSFGLFQSTADYGDLDALSNSAEEAARHGFDGATCVHPNAVPILNGAFSPSDEELAWAQNVLDEAARTGAGAFSLNGKMVDSPVLARARKALDRSK